jgi:hypothetical protein
MLMLGLYDYGIEKDVLFFSSKVFYLNMVYAQI